MLQEDKGGRKNLCSISDHEAGKYLFGDDQYPSVVNNVFKIPHAPFIVLLFRGAKNHVREFCKREGRTFFVISVNKNINKQGEQAVSFVKKHQVYKHSIMKVNNIGVE